MPAHQGTITLAVTDEHNGTTTLHYQLTPNQFADAIDHASVNGLKRIVAGSNHTCVLTLPGHLEWLSHACRKTRWITP